MTEKKIAQLLRQFDDYSTWFNVNNRRDEDEVYNYYAKRILHVIENS